MADWSLLASNQIPNYQDLKDAVASGDLACDSGSNCTSLSYANNRCLNWAALSVDFAFDGNQPQTTELPNKSEIDTYKVLCPDPGTTVPTSPSASVCDISTECGEFGTTPCCYIDLSWSDPAGADSCWDVRIQRDTSSSFPSPTIIATLAVSPGNNRSYRDGECDQLNAFTTYYYRLQYINGSDGDWSSTASDTTHGCDGQA